MTIYVTGDLHGGMDIQKLYDWEVGPTLSRDDYLIVAGDFGYPWDFSEEEEYDLHWLEQGSFTLLFVDGNHERYDWWAERPYEQWHGGAVQRLRPHSPIRRLCRGQVYDIDGCRIFTMGGATSVDQAWRTPQVNWWPQELPDERHFETARTQLDACDWQVDYVITHTCASSILPRALYPNPGWQYPEHDRLTDFFDELEAKLRYKRWYFGHMHCDRDCDERHTLLYNEIIKLGAGVDSPVN